MGFEIQCFFPFLKFACFASSGSRVLMSKIFFLNYSKKKVIFLYQNQSCGSMTFWCGSESGSADPCHRLMDADPVPSIFITDLQDTNKNYFKKKIFCLLLFKGTFTSFFKDKKSKRSHKAVGIKVFLTIFAW